VWGSGGIAPPFLKSALDGRECSASSSGRLTPGERASGIHCIADWVDLRTGLNAVEKIQTSCLESNPGRLTRRCANSAIVFYIHHLYLYKRTGHAAVVAGRSQVRTPTRSSIFFYLPNTECGKLASFFTWVYSYKKEVS
jgi:hypothetical protein